MRRLGIFLLAFLVTLGGVWAGVIWKFPGDAVSRYVEGRVNRSQGFILALRPAEMRWNRLYVPRAEIRRRDKPESPPLFVLTDFTVPVTWRLVRGLPARAVLGKKGWVEVFLPWNEGEKAILKGDMLLEEVALPAVMRPIALKGHFIFSGEFTMSSAARAGTELPSGTLEGKGTNLTITGVTLGGKVLKVTRLSNLELRIHTGKEVRMEKVLVQGDVQGNVTGRLTPDLRNPRNTLLTLQINASFRNAWLAGLGRLRPVAESYLKNGRLTLTLDGTVGRPRLRVKK